MINTECCVLLFLQEMANRRYLSIKEIDGIMSSVDFLKSNGEMTIEVSWNFLGNELTIVNSMQSTSI